MSVEEIHFWGGMALLISSITGPGLTTIPLLFQEAGWFTPVVTFLLFAALSGVVSLFLVETMSTIRGNEAFQAHVEFSTIAHLYLGKKAHICMQVVMYCALQSVNVASIIISNQTMDTLLIQLFHKTCALSFTQGWVCVSQINPSGSPFDSYILFSFGYLVTAAMVIPLSLMSLVQNVKFQFVSVAVLFFIMLAWIYLFAHHGLHVHIPAFGSNQSGLIGFVLNNLAFVTTVPSFINELSRSVSIHHSIIYPIVVCVALYLIIGLLGAASFQIDASSDILATLSSSGQNKVLITMVNVLFPIAVLVTSVPVFAIVIRYNLVRGNFCSNAYAIVWASLMPWILIIPFQTRGWLILVMNWTSLIFGSAANYLIPLVLFLSSKTRLASVADAEGGDLFLLHRDDSSSSTQSRRRSASVRRALASAGVPLLTIATPEEDNENGEPSDDASRPLVVITTPSVLKHVNFTPERSPTRSPIRRNEDLDLEHLQPEGSTSAIDPSDFPLRVVYSPTVSRNPSIGNLSPRPSISIPPKGGADLENQVQGENSELKIETETQGISLPSPTLSLRPPSQIGSPTRRLSFQEAMSSISFQAQEPNGEDHSVPIFKAFPETKWLRSIVVAKISLVIVACCVVANLIYIVVETVKGNNPFGG